MIALYSQHHGSLLAFESVEHADVHGDRLLVTLDMNVPFDLRSND